MNCVEHGAIYEDTDFSYTTKMKTITVNPFAAELYDKFKA